MPFSLPGRWCFFLCFLPLFCSGIAVILKRRQESTVSLNTLPWHTHTPKILFTNPMHLNSVVGKGSFYFKFEYCACCLGSLGNFHFWSSLENTRRIKAEESRWEVRSGGGGRWQGLMPLEWVGRMGDRPRRCPGLCDAAQRWCPRGSPERRWAGLQTAGQRSGPLGQNSKWQVVLTFPVSPSKGE